MLNLKRGGFMHAQQMKEPLYSFIQAFHDNNVAKVIELINNGADVNARDKYGRTPLMYAVDRGCIEICRVLIKAGADVNAWDASGITSLMIAIFACNIKLHKSTLANNIKLVELLVQNGADVNAKDEEGRTPLMYAVWMGNIELIQYLIQHGADVNAKDKNGNTLIEHTRNKEMKEQLLRLVLRVGKPNVLLSNKQHIK